MVRSGQFDVAGVSLNWRLDGEGGEPLVCIHGVGSYLEAWNGVAERLRDRFAVLTFDLRGHGRSCRVKGRYEIDDFVAETLALAEHVGFTTFHLAGFSLGGLIAQRLALTYPERLRKLVFLSTVAGRTPEERQAVRGRLAALVASDASAHHTASLSRWLTEDFQERNPDVIAELRRRDAENDRDCYAAAYRVLAETDFGGILDRITCPTLIVTGEDDQGSSPRMARLMHEQIKDSRLAILPSLRHSILIEAPAQVAAAMADFLLDIPRTAELSRMHGRRMPPGDGPPATGSRLSGDGREWPLQTSSATSEDRTGPGVAASQPGDADLVGRKLRSHDRLNGHERMGLNDNKGTRT